MQIKTVVLSSNATVLVWNCCFFDHEPEVLVNHIKGGTCTSRPWSNIIRAMCMSQQYIFREACCSFEILVFKTSIVLCQIAQYKFILHVLLNSISVTQ